MSTLLNAFEIYSLFGPNWDKDVKALCHFFGENSLNCAYVKQIQVGPIAGGEITGLHEVSVQ